MYVHLTDPDSPQPFHEVPDIVRLCYYAHVGNLELVKQIVESGTVNVNQADYSDRTALHAAAAAGHAEIVEYLVQQGADRTIQDSWGITPIGKYVTRLSLHFLLNLQPNTYALSLNLPSKCSVTKSLILSHSAHHNDRQETLSILERHGSTLSMLERSTGPEARLLHHFRTIAGTSISYPALCPFTAYSMLSHANHTTLIIVYYKLALK